MGAARATNPGPSTAGCGVSSLHLISPAMSEKLSSHGAQARGMGAFRSGGPAGSRCDALTRASWRGSWSREDALRIEVRVKADLIGDAARLAYMFAQLRTAYAVVMISVG